MSNGSRILQKLVVGFLILNLLVCPFVFVGMMWVPKAIRFLEPVLCPDDMQMGTESEQRSDRDGTYTATTVICVGDHGDVDVTWKVFLIMFGFPALGVVVFLIAPSSKEKEETITLNPDGND
jgi:hypothetical protein